MSHDHIMHDAGMDDAIADDGIAIVPYDSAWPLVFKDEQEKILSLFSDVRRVAVEHMGSTAIVGMGAKPVIDMMLGLMDLNETQAHMPGLKALGYEHVPEVEKEIPGRSFFIKRNAQGIRTHHLHAVDLGRDFWFHHLLFRDYLSAHSADAKIYFEGKVQLALKFKNDRQAYTNAKTALVNEVMEKAEGGFCQFCC